jgi:hypothetical protein
MESGRVSANNGVMKPIARSGLRSTISMSMSAGAGSFGFRGDSLKEEVLRHDGDKIIATRAVERGVRQEIRLEFD